MRIGGFRKVSFIDYPGRVASVIFTQGCNFRCPYCHNRDLVLETAMRDLVPEQYVFDYLAGRKDKIQGVVITGGEPTLQSGLKAFLEKIKAMGYAVKLDSNGSRPSVLQDLLQADLVDFIAMDVKATAEKYSQVAGVPVNLEHIQESIDLILASGIPHQFRTTVVKPLISATDLAEIRVWLRAAPRYVLQNFTPAASVLDPTLLDCGHYTDLEFSALQSGCERGVLAASSLPA